MAKDLLSPFFAKHLNTVFRSQGENNEELHFQLVKISDRTAPDGYECFSLFFLAPNNTPIKQRTYRLEHAEIDSIDVFLVPTSQHDKGITFEAVFNRLIG